MAELSNNAEALLKKRQAALRDFDDDDDPNQNRSAIAIGKDATWEKEAAVVNVDGTIGESAFDGFQRLGTNREILSWPGDSGEHYLVKTEGDEAKAQANLRKERARIRAEGFAKRAEAEHQLKLEKARRNKEFRARQAEFLQLQAETLQQDKVQREKVMDREATVAGYYSVADAGRRALFAKNYMKASTASSSRTSRGSPTMLAAGSPAAPESPM